MGREGSEIREVNRAPHPATYDETQMMHPLDLVAGGRVDIVGAVDRSRFRSARGNRGPIEVNAAPGKEIGDARLMRRIEKPWFLIPSIPW